MSDTADADEIPEPASHAQQIADLRARPGESWEDFATRIGLTTPALPPRIQLDADIDGYVGRRIRYARHVSCTTQADLAAMICITQSRLSRIERALTSAHIGELVRIAIQLQRSLEWFVTPPEEDREDVVTTGWERVERAPFDLDAFLSGG